MAKSAKQRTCKKGYTCGNGCISRTKTCRSNLGPDGQKLVEDYAAFVRRITASGGAADAAGGTGQSPSDPALYIDPKLMGEGVTLDSPELQAMKDAALDATNHLIARRDKFEAEGNQIGVDAVTKSLEGRGFFDPPAEVSLDEWVERSGKGPENMQTTKNSYDRLDPNNPIEADLRRLLYVGYTDAIDPQSKALDGTWGHRQKAVIAWESGGKDMLENKTVKDQSPEDLANFTDTIMDNHSPGHNSPGSRAVTGMLEGIWAQANQEQKDAITDMLGDLDRVLTSPTLDPTKLAFLQEVQQSREDTRQRRLKADEEEFLARQSKIEDSPPGDLGELADLLGDDSGLDDLFTEG